MSRESLVRASRGLIGGQRHRGDDSPRLGVSASYQLQAGQRALLVPARSRETDAPLHRSAEAGQFGPAIQGGTDAGGNAVPEVTVLFTAPASGAGANLSAASAITNPSGIASITATANATAGSFNVVSTVSGVAGSATFSLVSTASGGSGTTASFLGADNVTQGNWKSVYGSQGYFIPNVATSYPAGLLTRIALTDGERALQIRVKGKLRVTLILDLMHAMEKLWKAAYVCHAEGSLEADLWVLERTLRILSGDVGQVIKGLRQSVTKRRLSGAPQKTLQSVAGYLSKNRSYMHYDKYLAKGWPIASGPVEGACKNLIRDRMERSGMRWTEAIAEAVVKLRAVYLSGDFDAYWEFHIQQDQQRLYPARWTAVPK